MAWICRQADRLALLISLVAIVAAALVAERVFERIPHLEDEMAYVWQAQAITRGEITLPSPPEPKSLLVPFVVDYQGQRFGKYPLGWPVLLAAGVLFGVRWLVNSLLAGLGVWLTYRLGKRLLGEVVGLLAALLTLTSPFFLINSGSLLSHPFGLVLSTGFALAWLDAFALTPEEPSLQERNVPVWMPVLTAALCMALLALSRPLTAVGVALPFAVHGLWLLGRGTWAQRKRLVAFGVIALALSSLHFLWQYAVTGDPFLNPYTLWWPYDSIGFRVGVGRNPAGHSLAQAWANTQHSLSGGFPDLFGWGAFSWALLPVGLLAIRRNWRAWMAAGVFPALVAVYLLYWVGALLYGPRYYYEGLFSLTLLSAAAIAYLAGWPVLGTPPLRWRGHSFSLRPALQRARPWLVGAALLVLIGYNFAAYLPERFASMYGLYDIRRSRLEPFQTDSAQRFTPALIIVHPANKWTDYGALLDLSSPFLDTPFVFAHTRGPEVDAAVASHFPDRKVYHYYTDEPYKFYRNPRGPVAAP